MALFFDTAWFDERLSSLGLARTTLAAALGLNESEIAEVWKDQRELSAHDVSIIAALLATTGEEIASRAGVSTPVPRPADPSLKEIADRLARVEEKLAEIAALLRTRA